MYVKDSTLHSVSFVTEVAVYIYKTFKRWNRNQKTKEKAIVATVYNKKLRSPKTITLGT